MSILLQISDPHFGTERPAVVEALLRLTTRLQPDVALLSGDITQRARPRQWRAASAFVQRLRATHVMAIPGNHDIPLFDLRARLLAPYAGYRSVFGDLLEPVLDLPDLKMLGVNTTRWWRHNDGEVSPRQVDAVCAQLRRARPGQLRVVVTHQPVHVIKPEDENNLLHGAAHAVPRWLEAGADLIIGGHIHLPYVRPLAERYPHPIRKAWCVQAGTAVSHRVRGGIPNSVNVIQYEKARCTVERWDYAALHDEFERAQTMELMLQGRSRRKNIQSGRQKPRPAEYSKG